MPRPSEVEYSQAIQNQCLLAGAGSDVQEHAEQRFARLGEICHAHHLVHVSIGGLSAHLSNCVILCQSCHYSVHEGGNYRFGTVKWSLPRDHPHFYG